MAQSAKAGADANGSEEAGTSADSARRCVALVARVTNSDHNETAVPSDNAAVPRTKKANGEVQQTIWFAKRGSSCGTSLCKRETFFIADQNYWVRSLVGSHCSTNWLCWVQRLVLHVHCGRTVELFFFFFFSGGGSQAAVQGFTPDT